MLVLAFLLVLGGGLQVILEFGSVTFIIVSFLMAFANFKKRRETGSHVLLTLTAMIFLFVAGVLIFAFQFMHAPKQLVSILVIYAILIIGALMQSRLRHRADFEAKPE